MKEVGAATQCLTDTFTVTNPSGLTPPSICGLNTNSHSKIFFISGRALPSSSQSAWLWWQSLCVQPNIQLTFVGSHKSIFPNTSKVSIFDTDNDNYDDKSSGNNLDDDDDDINDNDNVGNRNRESGNNKKANDNDDDDDDDGGGGGGGGDFEPKKAGEKTKK